MSTSTRCSTPSANMPDTDAIAASFNCHSMAAHPICHDINDDIRNIVHSKTISSWHMYLRTVTATILTLSGPAGIPNTGVYDGIRVKLVSQALSKLDHCCYRYGCHSPAATLRPNRIDDAYNYMRRDAAQGFNQPRDGGARGGRLSPRSPTLTLTPEAYPKPNSTPTPRLCGKESIISKRLRCDELP